MWVAFTNKKGEAVRVAVNPWGAYLVQLFRNTNENGEEEEEVLAEGMELPANPDCSREDGSANWNCRLQLPWSLLPAEAAFFQVLDQLSACCIIGLMTISQFFLCPPKAMLYVAKQ